LSIPDPFFVTPDLMAHVAAGASHPLRMRRGRARSAAKAQQKRSKSAAKAQQERSKSAALCRSNERR
jgi:hypothetical protein